jgi:hypothetical protein
VFAGRAGVSPHLVASIEDGTHPARDLPGPEACACPAAIESAAVAWMVSASFRAWPDESGLKLKAAGATAIRATAHLGRGRLTQIG